MAKVYVSEYSAVAVANGISGVIPQEPAVASQTVAIGGSSAPSAAFNAATRFIRVSTDAICSIEIGPDAVATANSKRMAAGAMEVFGVRAGDKIAVITNT